MRLVGLWLFASKNTSDERWHPWILSWILHGATSPLASLYLLTASYLCPTSGFDAFLVLITSPSSYSTFSSFASPEISLHLSIFLVVSASPQNMEKISHRMKHVTPQESDPYGQFPSPETQKYKVSTNRHFRENLRQPSGLGSLSPSMIQS